MSFAAAAFAGLALMFPNGAQRHDMGSGWLLTTRWNDFAGSITCTLRKREAEYSRQVLALRLGRRTNTLDAVYRIDEGPPLRSVDDQAVIAKRGFLIYLDDLQNPSGGLVRIPIERLQAAERIRIDAAGDGRRPVTFRIAGLQAALDGARQWGCEDGSFR